MAQGYISTDKFDRLVETVRLTLVEQCISALWSEGAAMTLEQVVAYALQETSWSGRN